MESPFTHLKPSRKERKIVVNKKNVLSQFGIKVKKNTQYQLLQIYFMYHLVNRADSESCSNCLEYLV